MNKIIVTDPAPTACKEIFSHNMAYLMKTQDIKIAKMASDLKLSVFRINRWLSGACYPQYPIMVLLCNYLMYYDIYRLVTVKLDADSTGEI